MGVRTRIVLYAPGDSTARAAAKAAFQRIVALENVMSSYRSDSELRRLEVQAGGPPVEVSKPLFAVLQRAQGLARRSGGAFDVTIDPYIELWRTARQTGRLPPDSARQRADSLVGWRNVHLNAKARTVQLAVPGMQLNLGGIAKGYILDQALATLRKHGISRALIEAGGDIVVSGAPPSQPGWQVVIPSAGPRSEKRTVSITNAALSTSGDTQQFVEIDGTRYSHVIDPRTGLGLTNRIMATVIAPSGTTADALATTATILGPQKGQAFAKSHEQVSIYIRRAGESSAP